MTEDKKVADGASSGVSDSTQLLGSWQPIASAPRDGTAIILFLRGEITIGAYRDKGSEHPWVVFDVGVSGDPLNGWQEGKHGPTFWMNLPDEPND